MRTMEAIIYLHSGNLHRCHINCEDGYISDGPYAGNPIEDIGTHQIIGPNCHNIQTVDDFWAKWAKGPYPES